MTVQILNGNCIDVLKTLPAKSVDCIVTSPPYYGLRDYGTAKWDGGDENCDHEPNKESPSSTLEGGKSTQGSAKEFRTACKKCGAVRIDSQIGLEETPDAYVAKLVQVFREFRRVLCDTGTLWLNLGDSYAGSGMGAANYPDCASEKQLSNHGSTTARGRGGMTYGLKQKDLLGIPWMVAFALRNDGWYLRQDIIWAKPNPMPESVKDRCTKSHEYIFLLSKNQKYYYDYEAVLEPANYDGRKDTQYKGGDKDVSCFEHERWPAKIRGFKTKEQIDDNQHHGRDVVSMNRTRQTGIGVDSDEGTKGRAGDTIVDGLPARNKRSVWTITTKPYREAHFATYPPDLIEPCILAGCPQNGTVLDPFNGSGTTGYVAIKNNRNYIGIELNPKYIELTNKRLSGIDVRLI